MLDLTRVIAGPVASRTLGALGADVLRMDSPHRPELESQQRDGILSERSAPLDTRSAEAAKRLDELLAAADVVFQGYRPGASLAAEVGMQAATFAERYPGMAAVQLSAWGEQGAW